MSVAVSVCVQMELCTILLLLTRFFGFFFLLYRYLYEWNYHLIGKNSRQETFIKYKSESVTEGVHFCPSCFFH